MTTLFILLFSLQKPYVCGPVSSEVASFGDLFLIAPQTFDWRSSVRVSVLKKQHPPHTRDLVETSKTFLGVPYVWGGISQDGVDCSGFINQVYAKHGYDLPRVASEQAHVGLNVQGSDLQEGDVLFFSERENAITHVGMYIGEGQFIHASKGRGGVFIDALSKPYYQQRLRAQRRVVALPPGRYSTRYGRAVAHALFASTKDIRVSEDIRAYKPTQEKTALSTALLLENPAYKTRFWQLPPLAWEEPLPHRGLQEPLSDTSSVGIRMGTGAIDNTGVTAWAAEFHYINTQIDIKLRASAPFFVSYTHTPLQYNHWKTARDYGKILREFTLGERGAPFFLSFNRDDSLTLGYGGLVYGYTPNTSMKGLPYFPSHNTDTTLHIEQRHKKFQSTFFINDVWAPSLLGASVFKPLTKNTALSIIWAADLNRVQGGCIEASHSFQPNEAFKSEHFLHTCTVASSQYGSLGGAFGWKARLRPQRNNRHIVSWHTAFFVGTRNFVPMYFDTLYSLTEPLKHSVLAHDIKGSPRVEGVLELSYQWMRYMHAGILYQNGTPYPNKLGTQHITFFGALKNIPMGKKHTFLHITWGYHLKHFHDFAQAHKAQDGVQVLFAQASAELTPYLSLGASLRRSSSVLQSPGVSLDGMLDVRVSYGF